MSEAHDGRAAASPESDVEKLLREVREKGVVGAARRFGHVVTRRVHSYIDRDYDRSRGIRTSSSAYSQPSDVIERRDLDSHSGWILSGSCF